MSSPESDDDAFDAKQVVKQPKQQKVSHTNALYQNLLNANNKFSEMLKNKIKQSQISPIPKKGLNETGEYEFNPVASSTQIGTPMELQRAKAFKIKKNVKSSNSSSSSDETTSKSGKIKGQDSKTEIINISSTFANDNSSSESSDDTKDKNLKKFSVSSNKKPTTSDSSSDSESIHIKSKNSGKDETTANADNKRNTKLGKVKNKGSNGSFSSSDHSFVKISESVKLHSISSEEDSGSDSDVKKGKGQQIKNKASKNDNHKLTSKKRKDEQISSSDEYSSDKNNIRKTKHKLRKSSSSSGSESEDVPTTKFKSKPLKMGSKKVNNSSYEKRVGRYAKRRDSLSSNEEVDAKSNKGNIKNLRKDSSSDNSSTSGSESDKSQHRQKPTVEKHNKIELLKRKNTTSLSSQDEATSSKKIPKKDSDDSSTSSSEGKRHNRTYNNSSDEFVKENTTKQLESPYVRLRKYEKEASLQKVISGSNFFNDIKSKEEVFLMQVPIKIDPKALINVNISLTKTIKIPQHKKYDSVPVLEAQDSVSLFCNNEDDHIRIVKPVGYIKIQRHLKNKSIAEVPEQPTNSVLFPHSLKERHPLFGSDFTNKINLEEHIKQKLEAAVEKYGKKKKKKEKKISITEKHEQQEEEIFKFLNQSLPSVTTLSSKKIKKSKTVGIDNNILKEKPIKKKETEAFELEASTSFADESFKKVKKKKHKEKYRLTVEEDTIDSKKRKKQDSDNDDSGKKKHKLDSQNEDSLIQQLLLNESASLYKKKKKKRKKSEKEDD